MQDMISYLHVIHFYDQQIIPERYIQRRLSEDEDGKSDLRETLSVL